VWEVHGAMCGKSMGLCGAMCKPVGLCVGSPWGYVGQCVSPWGYVWEAHGAMWGYV